MGTINNFPINTAESEEVSGEQASSLILNSLQKTAVDDEVYGFKGKTASPISASTGALRLRWLADTVTDPSPGQISANNVDFALVTELKISKYTTTTPQGDLSFRIRNLKEQNTLYIAVDQKPDSFAGLTITGSPVDKGVYWSLPVVVETVGNVANNGEYLLIAESATDKTPERFYCDYTVAPANLKLTMTPQLVTGWIEGVVPVGVSELNGRFTITKDAIAPSNLLERIYENFDRNPIDKVYMTIDVRKKGVSCFKRTLPIASATANDEPATPSFTTPFVRDMKAGDWFEIYVSGIDGAVDPRNTKLIRMTLTANL